MAVDEREEIALGVATERSFADVARQLARPTSTVAREVDRNGRRERYRASKAQRRAKTKAQRPKVRVGCDRGSVLMATNKKRQYFPKGTDLSVHAPEHLAAIEDELNRRPRIVLHDRAPIDLFTALLASPNNPVLRC